MWLLILIGGGVVVTLLAPISITGFGNLDSVFSSIVKGILAIILVAIWIVILTKMKHWVFNKTFNS